ncbi:MAG TPA: contractile injection system tape measure protein [Caulobacteraceae bacterium]|jgi:hypothetical protein
MTRRLAIRRVRLNGLTARDHPDPGSLERRLADAARSYLAPALADAAASWSGPEVLRVRRLSIDVTLDAGFDPEAFAALAARQIIAALNQADGPAGGAPAIDQAVAYPSRSAYVAALVEALAAGRTAADSWWLSDAEGLRFLPPAAAIRTVLADEPAAGLEALLQLPPTRLARVLAALGERESERVLDSLAATASATDAGWEACLAALAAPPKQAPLFASPTALALFLQAALDQPALAGPRLAEAARLWLRLARRGEGAAPAQAAALAAQLLAGDAPGEPAVAAMSPAARTLLAGALQAPALAGANASDAAPDWVLSRFGGLLLVLPSLELPAIRAAIEATAEQTTQAAWGTARLVAYAALGACAGRAQLGAWLGEPVWRELFGLDPRTSAAEATRQLAAVDPAVWAALAALGETPERAGDARFLLAPRRLTGSPAASRALAALANAALSRFARRLPAFGGSSAPFLWTNLLGAGAALARTRPGQWDARLSRPPLDVLLSLSRLAEGEIALPGGGAVRLSRVAP